MEFKFSCIVNINILEGKCDFKERSSRIISTIIDVDELYMGQKSNKVSDNNKYRDKQSMEWFTLRPNVTISPEIKRFILNNIDLLPREIYKRLVDHGLDINIRQKQIHFWWVELGKPRYKRDEDSFISAEKVAFRNRFKIREIGVDATYNTNNLKFELYVVHAEVDGMGIPLAYLFIENNGNCSNGIRTGIIIDFLVQLKTRGLNPDFLITDKDFAQISENNFKPLEKMISEIMTFKDHSHDTLFFN
ncbi:ATP-dependent DNA helicase Pif1 [Rhizophagus clarus]|uniref:ATP-dependent DNA helicase Pif1 n=1 Tax=Rhizophagus clarus TaxID=94130 RepID=A0A8H3R1X3_9GLOM|nr:ATP-dependent DNA helicase Pif1 [Rhizophagus clarus]